MAGDALTQELYSPHLDMHQRMLILETLASAAQQLADPRLRLKAGHASGASGGQQAAASRRLQDAANSDEVRCILYKWGACLCSKAGVKPALAHAQSRACSRSFLWRPSHAQQKASGSKCCKF